MKNQLLMAVLGFNLGMIICWVLMSLILGVESLVVYYVVSALVSIVLAALGYFVGASMA